MYIIQTLGEKANPKKYAFTAGIFNEKWIQNKNNLFIIIHIFIVKSNPSKCQRSKLERNASMSSKTKTMQLLQEILTNKIALLFSLV